MTDGRFKAMISFCNKVRMLQQSRIMGIPWSGSSGDLEVLLAERYRNRPNRWQIGQALTYMAKSGIYPVKIIRDRESSHIPSIYHIWGKV